MYLGVMALIDGALPVGVSMWKLTQPWWEFVLRGLVVYVAVVMLLRMTGKRQVGQLASIDLVLLMLLANAVQNSMNAGDNSVSGGFVLVMTLIAINGLASYLTSRNKRVELLLDGKPRILVNHGVPDPDVLRSERISHHELMAAVRQAGITEIEQVRVAILEANGRINVIARNHDSSVSDQGK